MIHVFILSYHRPSNCKTAKFLVRKGYDAKYIHVFLDSEADDIKEYEENMDKIGVTSMFSTWTRREGDMTMYTERVHP